MTLLASLAPSQAPANAKYIDMTDCGVTDPTHLEFKSVVGLERGHYDAQGHKVRCPAIYTALPSVPVPCTIDLNSLQMEIRLC